MIYSQILVLDYFDVPEVSYLMHFDVKILSWNRPVVWYSMHKLGLDVDHLVTGCLY